MDNSIEFKDVSFAFDGKEIISHFSEVIAAGEHVCIMGESGAGKSTLLNSVVGLTFPSKGEVRVGGERVDATSIQKVRNSVAWLPQNIQLPYDTVREMLEAPFALAVNKHLTFDRVRCLQLFEDVGLDPALYEKELASTSGGERQRISLVSTLMLGRKVLLMDEPTSALDVVNRDKLILLLKGLSDTTILAVTHDGEFGREMDRVITLKKK